MVNSTTTSSPGETVLSTAALQAFFALTSELFCSFDAAGQFLLLSPASKEVLGYHPGELTGKNYAALIHPADARLTTNALAAAREQQTQVTYENRFLRKDGRPVTLLWSVNWDADKACFYAVAKDSTQLSAEKSKRKEYEQRLFKAYKLSCIGWWEWNAATDTHIISDELYAICGLDKNVQPVFTTAQYFALVHPDDLSAVKKAVRKTLRSGDNIYDHRLIKPSGEIIHVIHYVKTVYDENGTVIQVHGTTKDITERKTAEAELKLSQRTLETILNSIGDVFFALDHNGFVTYWNPKAAQLFQQEKEAILGKHFPEVFRDAHSLQLYAAFQRAMRDQVAVHLEDYFPQLDRWFDVSAYPTTDMLAIYIRDCTDRRQNELALQHSYERYETITKASFDAIWDYDRLTDRFYRSPGFQAQYGFHAGSALSNDPSWKRSIHPDDLTRVLAFYHALLESSETSWFQEFRFQKKDGTYALVQDKGVVVRDDTGYAVRLIGVLRDITETQYLQSLEKLERDVLEMNASLQHDLRDIVQAYLTGIEALHPGMLCSVVTLRDDRVYHFVAPHLPEAFIVATNGLPIGLQAGSCGTAAFLKERVIANDIRNDPRWTPYRDIALEQGLQACWSHPILDAAQTVMAVFACYFTDVRWPTALEERTLERTCHILKIILEYRRQEDALVESNLRYQYASRATSDAIWDWNLETDTHYWGEGFETCFGYPGSCNEDISVDYWVQNIHPLDQERVVDGFFQVVQGTDVYWREEYRFRKADGTWVDVVDQGYVIRNKAGKPLRMVGGMRDVSRQKEADRLIQFSEERFKLLFHQSPKPKWMFAADGFRMVEVNEAALRLYGYTREEFLALTVPDLTFAPDLASFSAFQEPHNDHTHTIVRHIKKSGDLFYMELTAHAIELPAGRHYIVDGEDMTEKLALQQRLITERVNAQKQLGEAVLHAQERERSQIGRELHDNVNQVLTSAKLYQELALSGIGRPEDYIRKSIQLVQDAISENRNLSKQLSAPSLGNIRLSESVKELADLVQATNAFTLNLHLHAIHELEVNKDVHLGIFRILQEQLTNIQKYASASRVDIGFSFTEEELVLTIADNGQGFDPSQPRNGLGISNMTMRAESLGGTLTLDSVPGNGCTVVIRIPFVTLYREE